MASKHALTRAILGFLYPVCLPSHLRLTSANASGLAVCQTFPLATVRNNPSTSYKVQISNLPWSRNSNYRVTIQRVGDGKVQRVYKTSNGRGNSVGVLLSIARIPDYQS